MAQIRARRQVGGSTRYTAIIPIRKGRALIQQEYRTFAQRSAAASWAKHRQVQLENQAMPGRRRHEPITLAALIRWYIERAILGSRTETHIVYRLGNATGRLLAESGLATWEALDAWIPPAIPSKKPAQFRFAFCAGKALRELCREILPITFR